MVTRWYEKSQTFQDPKTTKQLKIGTGRRVTYDLEEQMLFHAVFVRRQLLGLWIDRYWLQDEFYEILKRTQPEGWRNFKCSNGWVSGFCRRYCITQQARSNKKDVPAAVKEPLIRIFHRRMLELQRSVRSDPRYGRFSPLRMFHADQSPCEWAMPGKRTLNIQGTPCWMWQPGTGLDKRFITIHLCIRAGDQIIKPVIIFRGQGLRISPQEKAALDALTNIRWYFQPKAWADGEFCQWFLESFKADLTAAGIEEEVLLGLDGLKGQHN